MEIDELGNRVIADLADITSFSKIYIEGDSFTFGGGWVEFYVRINKAIRFQYKVTEKNYDNNIAQVRKSIIKYGKN